MNIKKIAKWKILVGIWALLLIPFYVANSMYFPFISGKNFIFRIIIELIFAVWVYLAFVDVRYRPKFSWVALATGVFVLVMAVADFFSVNPAKAFWSNFERMDGWITLIHLFMFLLVAGSVMKTEKIWLWLFRSVVVSPFLFIVYEVFSFSAYIKKYNLLNPNEVMKFTGSGYMEHMGLTGERWAGPTGNPIYLAIFFLFVFFFTLILFYKDVIVTKIQHKKQLLRILKDPLTYTYLILAVVWVFGIWKTGTRGVLLGLLGGLVVSALIIAIFEKKNKLMRNTAIGGLVAVVILIAGFFAIKDTQFVKKNVMLNRLASISLKDVLAGKGIARQYVWGMAFDGFKEKPILGWGQDGFNNVFNKYYDVRMYDQEQWFDRAHSMPIDVLIAGGLVGLISYLGIFVAALWLIWKRKNRLGIIDAALLVGLLAGYFFQNLFEFDNLISYILFFVVLAYIHSSDTEDAPNNLVGGVWSKNQTEEGVCDEKANYIVLPLVILTLGVSLWYFNYKPIVANLSLIKSMQPQKEGLAKNIEYFNKALSQDTFADSEILEQLLNVTMKVVSLDVDMKTKEAFVGFTLAQAEKQLKQTPDDARYQFFVGGFLVNLEQYEMALPLLEKAVELSPNKLTMLFELSNCLSHLGQKERSLEIAKKAYDLVPKYNQGKLNYAFALIRNGEEKKAKEILGTETIDNEKIIRAYLLNAADFIKTGNKSSAVLEVQKAMKISPGFEKQGKDVISAIWAGTLK